MFRVKNQPNPTCIKMPCFSLLPNPSIIYYLHTSIAATAASRQIREMSAPVQPSERKANSSIHTSELQVILLKWIQKISARSFSFGGPTYTSLSKRPVKFYYIKR